MPQLQQIRWAREIEETLKRENLFLNQAKNDNAYLNGNKVVVPQAGNLPAVEKNRTSLPASATARTDTYLEYTLDQYTLGPILVPYKDMEELSFDKMRSILSDVEGTLTQYIGDSILYDWTPGGASTIVRTSGSNVTPVVTGQTGVRKAVTKADILAVKQVLDRQNVPQAGRVCVIPAEFLTDLLGIADFVDADKLGAQQSRLIDGSIGRILGFDVMVRSQVVMFDNTGTPVKKSLGATVNATDHHAAIFWHPNFVRRAYGTVQNGGIDVGIDPKRADYDLASLVTMLVRYGGKISRSDNKGVVSLVQATGV